MDNSDRGVPGLTLEEVPEFERLRREILDDHIAHGGGVLPPDDGSSMQVFFAPTPLKPPSR